MTDKRHYTKEQVDLLVKHYADMRTEDLAMLIGKRKESLYRKADKLGLKKSAEYLASPSACRLRRGDEVGKEFRFKKNQAAWNKGMKGLDLAGDAGKATQFKKGQKPHSWKPIGSERITSDGYLQRKVTDTGYPPRDWVMVHKLVWIEKFGEITKGMFLRFKDKNTRNIAIENLELVDRAENMRRNSYHNNFPKEIAELIQLRGAVNRQINRREKNERPITE